MLDIDFEKRREELGGHLVDYLAHHGIIPNGSGMIQCLSGKHSDSHPSMRVKKPNENGLYCFTCQSHLDIFDLANNGASETTHEYVFRRKLDISV